MIAPRRRRRLGPVLLSACALIALPLPAAAATRTVTVFTDTAAGTPAGTGTGNAGDLRTQMLAASPGDTINFSCSSAPCTITLNGPLPPITGDLTIDGGSFGTVVIDGNNAFRAFFVDSGRVTIANLTIRNAKAKGGNGGGGSAGATAGGGGAGLGAGVFVNQAGADVTLNRISFVNAAAVGGNGGTSFGSNGGGGGIGADGAVGFNLTRGNGGGGVLGAGTAHDGNPVVAGNGGLGGGGGGGASDAGAAGLGGAAYAGNDAGGNGIGDSNGRGGDGGFGGGGGAGYMRGGDGGFGGGGGGSGWGTGGNGGPGGGGGTGATVGTGGSLGGGIAGGDGKIGTGAGGGGGAAAGPAIFVRLGRLTTIATTSTGETAVGGSGGNPGGASTAAVFNFGGTVNGSTTTGPATEAMTAPSYGLTVTTAGTGTGLVTSSTGGISCPGTCTASIASITGSTITEVTLTASPAAGSSFTGWSGSCTGTATTATVTMSAARACTATFGAVTAGGGSSGAPSTTPGTALPAFVAAPLPVMLEVGAVSGNRISLASSFDNPGALAFSASTSGGGLPSWLTFDPATVSFTYNLPTTANLPFLPAADQAKAATAANSANTTYPPLIRLAQLPITLTASGPGGSYSATVNMSFYAPRPRATIAAVSLDTDGAAGDAASVRPALSYDAGQAIFESAATNLFPAAANAQSDIVRYHALSGSRDRLSQTAIPGGGVANAADGASTSPAVSADGRFAAFASEAPSVTLVPYGGLRQVYRVGLGYPRLALSPATTPAPDFVSIRPDGTPGNGPSDNPALSEDGRFVAFESTATNFAPGLTGTRQVWRKDLTTGAVDLVSGGALPGDGASGKPSISWDGRYIAFESTAANLASGTSGAQIYLKDMATGTVRLISAAHGTAGNAGSAAPQIDARGGRIAFATSASNLGFANPNGKVQVAVADLATGRISLASVSATGVAGNGDSDQPAISADGSFLVFRSTASDLDSAVAGGVTQIWVRDLDRGVTALVSRAVAGPAGTGNSRNPAISGDATTIAFASDARDLVNGNPRAGQVYIAGNPLPLAAKADFWYATGSNGQGWVMERWGKRAYVGALSYDGTGRPVWLAGYCRLSGLACRGTLNAWSGGAVFGSSAATDPVATAGPAFSIVTAAGGGTAELTVGDGTTRTIIPFPIGGTTTTGYAGLPQTGWWHEPAADGGANGYFLAIDTQAQTDGSSAHVAYLAIMSFDTGGRPTWYAAQATLSTDLAFAGTLYRYEGGPTFGTAGSGGGATASTVGQVRLTFSGTDRATVNLPNGRTATLKRYRF